MSAPSEFVQQFDSEANGWPAYVLFHTDSGELQNVYHVKGGLSPQELAELNNGLAPISMRVESRDRARLHPGREDARLAMGPDEAGLQKKP